MKKTNTNEKKNHSNNCRISNKISHKIHDQRSSNFSFSQSYRFSLNSRTILESSDKVICSPSVTRNAGKRTILTSCLFNVIFVVSADKHARKANAVARAVAKQHALYAADFFPCDEPPVNSTQSKIIGKRDAINYIYRVHNTCSESFYMRIEPIMSNDRKN